jgi:hypothetical protein
MVEAVQRTRRKSRIHPRSEGFAARIAMGLAGSSRLLVDTAPLCRIDPAIVVKRDAHRCVGARRIVLGDNWALGFFLSCRLSEATLALPTRYRLTTRTR